MSVELTQETDIVKKVKDKELTKTEKIIYDYIRTNPKKVLLIGIRNLSDEINVSMGSIMKFCKNTLELGGYSDLKLQLAEDLAKANSTKAVVYNSVFESLENEYENIYKNIKMDTDPQKFKRFNHLINSAENILIYDTAFGGLSRIAISLFYRKGVKHVSFIDNMNLGIKNILDMKKNDVLLVISPGDDKFKAHNQLLDVCESKIISIVNDRLNSISQKSELTFYTNVEKYENGFIATLTYLRNLISYLDLKN